MPPKTGTLYSLYCDSITKCLVGGFLPDLANWKGAFFKYANGSLASLPLNVSLAGVTSLTCNKNFCLAGDDNKLFRFSKPKI